MPMAVALLGLLFLLAATPPVSACQSSADCACGLNEATGTCVIGPPGSLDTNAADCTPFCHGVFVDIDAVCRTGECFRTGRSPCPGDCDADAVVTVDEVLSGVGMALGELPAATCAAFDRARDGEVTIDEILPAVRAALDGCAAALAPSRGVELYDTVITSDTEGTRNALGTRSTYFDETSHTTEATLGLELGPNQNLYLYTQTGSDGSLRLSGSIVVTDVAFEVTGTAQRTETANEDRITGTLQTATPFGPFQTATFVMRRDPHAGAAHFAGTYRVTLSASPGDPQQASTLLLGLDVADNGVSVVSGGADTGTDGVQLGTVAAGTCSVAAGGSLSCSTAYLVAGSAVSAPLRLTGRLTEDAGGVSGGGAYLAGVDPPFDIYVGGSWTATRLNAQLAAGVGMQ